MDVVHAGLEDCWKAIVHLSDSKNEGIDKFNSDDDIVSFALGLIW